MNAELIEKEKISGINPVSYDVLSTPDSRKARYRELFESLIAGNMYKAKRRIVFHTRQGLRVVNTTIWSLTEEHVALKGGILLPICCISEVLR